MKEHDKVSHHDIESNQPPQQPPQQQPYGTFQGTLTPTAMRFPQPAPPPGSMDPPPEYFSRGYQSVPGYIVADGRPMRAYERLPCCGIGFGWFLFIIGFFLAGIPWYAAAIILICCRNVDPREKPGYVCCTIASVLAIIATTFGVSRLDD
ncbi:hypothetical protein RND81_12G220700 [Saponaria officinalis]|uniref:60S ribosomal protein L18a-like protein n=1 Tax=Saponaria officinalis TaxID=3572 RepID=A0AAW1HDX4_SAPOF